ncbi:MAG: cytidylyltransferase [Desulfovibrionaceae bacterium]|nr:cytidylyltransferase [Desulfovibrionaceae bacterium]MBF0512648.1 cytidylyltransferase [Desulfovibrionaceae bacterium]
MIAAICIGRKGSVGFPGKNVHPVLGRPLAAYPLLAARRAPSVEIVYLSTDDAELMAIGREHGASIIVRPPELATRQALGEDAYLHAYEAVKNDCQNSGRELELLVLLMANAATITAPVIEAGVAALRGDPSLDSAVSVSCYNMWSPLRARKVGPDELLHPFAPLEAFCDPAAVSCDRDSQGDVWFADMGVSVVRPRCLEDLHDGLLPQKWMGRRIHPLKQWGGLDVDYPWQLPGVEFWLRANGFSETATPYDSPADRA